MNNNDGNQAYQINSVKTSYKTKCPRVTQTDLFDYLFVLDFKIVW